MSAVVEHVEDATVVYLSKDSGERDAQPALLDDRLREQVLIRVGMLEAGWDTYQQQDILPPVLQPVDANGKPPWQCRAMDEDDPFSAGRYCRVRSVCMRLAAEGR